MKTGGHIKPCKVGQVEEHNERRPEYVERMKTSKHPLNFYPTLALRPNDNSYNTEREEYKDVKTKRPLKVAEIFKKMIEVYQEKDKRHRMPPLKERERFDPKSGKMKTIAGWSPIREMVVVIKPDTKRQDFAKVATWFRKNGVEPMFLSLHFDEGHLDEQGNLKANNHAHMGLDFFDWQTGKTVKLGPKKMKELQTVLADALGMERGEIKELTGKEHLDVVEQRLESKQKELMPKLMKMIGRSDRESLEEAMAIISHDREKTQRNLLNSEKKLRSAEKKFALADDTLQRLNDKEGRLNSLIENAKAMERVKMQAVADEWKGKFNTQVSLNHNKSDQLRKQQDTIREKDRIITNLRSTVNSLEVENKDLHKKLSFMEKVEKAMKDCCDWAAKCARGKAVWEWVYEKFEDLCSMKGLNQEWKNGRHSVAADVWLEVVDPDNGGHNYGKFTEQQQEKLSDELHKAADHPELGLGKGLKR